MTCPVDIEVYQKMCQVPVFGKTWNAWLWLRSTSDLPADPTERLRRIKFELASYYGGWAYDVDVTLLEALPPGPIEGHTTYKDAKGTVTRNRCPIAMVLQGSDYHPVFVRFVPVENEKRPWPALAKVFGSLSTMMESCPVGALWLLDRVLTTDDKEVPEAPEGFLESLAKGTLKDKPAIPWAADIAKAIIVAGVLYVFVEVLKTARAVAGNS